MKIGHHIVKYNLMYLGLLIHLLFYFSLLKTGWFDIFFSGPSLHHSFKGIDFYQVPRGAWAYWHGGSFTGAPLKDGSVYAKEPYGININVYHPLFTVLLGSFLSSFDPLVSPFIWLWMKLSVSLLVIAYFFWNFRKSTSIQFAVFVLFANFSEYLELAAWQFHFVLNILLFMFLIHALKKRKVIWSSAWYWLSLLVKPVALLFVPMLLFKRRWGIVVIGVGGFALATWLYLLSGKGNYYVDNLMSNILHPWYPGPDQIITLNALLHNSTHWPDVAYAAIQYAILGLIIFLSSLRRIHMSKAIFLYIVYFLYFYNLAFEYDWSTLAYVIAVCVVCCPSFQTWSSKLCILLTCLPSCFVILSIFHIDVSYDNSIGMHPGLLAWQLMVISKVVPVFLLCISVLAPDVMPIFKQMKVFWLAIRKVNEQLEVFGEGQSKPDLAPDWWRSETLGYTLSEGEQDYAKSSKDL